MPVQIYSEYTLPSHPSRTIELSLTVAESSLIRHSKRCMQVQPQISVRQKSCLECTTSKTRCDQKRPSCSRCAGRKTPCQYALREPPATESISGSDNGSSDSTAPNHLEAVTQYQDANLLLGDFWPDNTLSPLCDESNILGSKTSYSGLSQVFHSRLIVSRCVRQ